MFSQASRLISGKRKRNMFPSSRYATQTTQTTRAGYHKGSSVAFGHTHSAIVGIITGLFRIFRPEEASMRGGCPLQKCCCWGKSSSHDIISQSLRLSESDG